MQRAVISEEQYADFHIALKNMPRSPLSLQVAVIVHNFCYIRGTNCRTRVPHTSHADSPARVLYWFTFVLHVVVSWFSALKDKGGQHVPIRMSVITGDD